MRDLEQRRSDLIRRLASRGLALASLQSAALLVVGCHLEDLARGLSTTLLTCGMVVSFTLVFIQIWGALELLRLRREQNWLKSSVWLWHFRWVYWTSVGLIGFDLLGSLVVLGEGESGWGLGRIAVKLLYGSFWIAQAVDAQRAHALALGAPSQKGEGLAPPPPGVRRVLVYCVALGSVVALGVAQLGKVGGWPLLAQAPGLTLFYGAILLSIHRRSLLGSPANLAWAAACDGSWSWIPGWPTNRCLAGADRWRTRRSAATERF